MNSKPDIPPPTLWPVTLALGACLLAWGLITEWPVLAAGAALFIRGGVGWIADLRNG